MVGEIQPLAALGEKQIRASAVIPRIRQSGEPQSAPTAEIVQFLQECRGRSGLQRRLSFDQSCFDAAGEHRRRILGAVAKRSEKWTSNERRALGGKWIS